MDGFIIKGCSSLNLLTVSIKAILIVRKGSPLIASPGVAVRRFLAPPAATFRGVAVDGVVRVT